MEVVTPFSSLAWKQGHRTRAPGDCFCELMEPPRSQWSGLGGCPSLTATLWPWKDFVLPVLVATRLTPRGTSAGVLG